MSLSTPLGDTLVPLSSREYTHDTVGSKWLATKSFKWHKISTLHKYYHCWNADITSNATLLANPDTFYFCMTFDIICILIYKKKVSCDQSKVWGVCLMTRQQVFKVMGVSKNPVLAAKRAICFISAVNWLQVDMFAHSFPPYSRLSGHTASWFIRSDVTNDGKKYYLLLCLWTDILKSHLLAIVIGICSINSIFSFISRGSHPLCCRWSQTQP